MNKALLLLTPFAVAGATAFLDYLVNSAQPFSTATLQHAAIMAALVDLAILKNMLPQAGAK